MMIKFILIFFNLLFALNAFPQQKGEINGRITDKTTQQPIIGGIVEIIQITLKTGTDENGYFILSDIPVGIYSVKFKDRY